MASVQKFRAFVSNVSVGGDELAAMVLPGDDRGTAVRSFFCPSFYGRQTPLLFLHLKVALDFSAICTPIAESLRANLERIWSESS